MDGLEQDIADFLSGKMPPEQQEIFLRWLDTDEGVSAIERKIDAFWDEGEEEQDTFDSLNACRLFEQIQLKKDNQRFLQNGFRSLVEPREQEIKVNRWKRSLSVAAVIIFILATSVFAMDKWGYEEQQEVAALAKVEKCNPAGQKSTILLPDGSKVTLNSESKVWYFSDYGDRRREIHLKGEAFFEVKKDVIPFVVISGEVATTALGTSFNIKSFEGNCSEVSLITGKVSVDHILDQTQKIMLVPGEAATYGTGKELKKSHFDVRTKTLWKDGIINFDHTPFEEAMRTLERWYGVNISVVKSTDRELYCTGRFKNDYLNNVLESMSFTLGFHYEIDQKDVILEF